MNDPHPDVLSHLLRKVDSPKNKMRLLRAYFPTAKNPVSAASRSGVNVAPVREHAAAYIQDSVRHRHYTKKRALKYIAAHDRDLVQEVVQQDPDPDLPVELSWAVVDALKDGDLEAAKWIIDRYPWLGVFYMYRSTISRTFEDSDKANVYFLFKNVARTKAEQVEMIEIAMDELNDYLRGEPDQLTRIDMKFYNFILTLATKFNLVTNLKPYLTKTKKFVSDILRSHRDPQVKRIVSALNIPVI